MLKTILLLISALILLPLAAYYLDDPLTDLQKHMLRFSLYIMLGVAAFCFLLGELTGNYSQVDKLWSLLPIIYTFYFAYSSGWDPRLTMMAVLVTVWGLRLTYNFSRKGGYDWKFWSGQEDYRWQILRKEPLFNTKLKWAIFNLIFISFYQNTLILLFTLPALKAAVNKNPLGIWDITIAFLILLAVCMETIADQQQWKFQKEKYRRLEAGEPLESPYLEGYISSGLWKYVRHPNYTSEQAIWILFYGYSISSTGKWLNWSAAGFILILLLFQGSSDFSEKISASKYPSYSSYRKKTGRFLPKWK